MAPAGVLIKLLAAIDVPEHTDTFPGDVIAGKGLIVTVYVIALPVQLPIEGITVIVPVIGELVVFNPVKPGTCPVPLAPKPIDVFEFVQV